MCWGQNGVEHMGREHMSSHTANRVDLLIVGGTAAGTAAAAAARRAAPGARILLVDKGRDLAYSTCELPMYAGGQIHAEEELVRYTSESFSAAFGVDVWTGAEVVEFGSRNRSARLADGRTVTWQRLILAVGARAHVPDFVWTDSASDSDSAGLGPGVFVLRTLEDARRIRARFEREAPAHLVVIGAGYTGLEAAAALGHDTRVSIVAPGARLLPSGLSEPLSRVVAGRLAAGGLVIRAARATGLDRAPDGRPLAVRTDDGEKIGCGAVILAAGIQPNTELATSLGLRLDHVGAIRVTTAMRTNKPHIWAAGDCAAIPEAITGRPRWIPLAMNAFRTGRVAGRNAVFSLAPSGGRPATLTPAVAAFAVRLAGLDLAHAGLRLEEALAANFAAEAVDIVGASHSRTLGGGDVHVRLVFDTRKGQLLGAETVGPPGSALRMNTVAALLRLGGSVDDLEASDTVYHPDISPLHDPLRVAARTAQKHLAQKRFAT